jgi:hypothetical protein
VSFDDRSLSGMSEGPGSTRPHTRVTVVIMGNKVFFAVLGFEPTLYNWPCWRRRLHASRCNREQQIAPEHGCLSPGQE